MCPERSVTYVSERSKDLGRSVCFLTVRVHCRTHGQAADQHFAVEKIARQPRNLNGLYVPSPTLDFDSFDRSQVGQRQLRIVSVRDARVFRPGSD